MFCGPEASDSLVFVLKDGNTWYDNRGDNFEVLTSCLPSAPCPLSARGQQWRQLVATANGSPQSLTMRMSLAQSGINSSACGLTNTGAGSAADHHMLITMCSQIALREGEAAEVGEEKKAPVEVADPPSELCGIWAYIKWENDGCPNRSAQESDAEYQASIRVCNSCLRFCPGVGCEKLGRQMSRLKQTAQGATVCMRTQALA